MDIGKERNAHACLRTDFPVLGLQGEVQIVHVKHIPRLTEGSRDPHHVVGHQTRFENLLVGAVPVLSASLGEQTRHFSRFILKTPHQMAVFGVAGLVDQPDGHGFVIVALVAAVFRQQA